MEVKRAALYLRVSTEEQAQHGYSLDAQLATLRKYAAEHSMKIVGEYCDEGITARKSYKRRPQLLSLLQAVENKELDIILFIKLDRWFRNIADFYEVQQILDAHHVDWIATEENYNTNTANGRLHLNIKLSIAQDEADRTSERISFVFRDKKQRGEVISGKIPYGYTIQDKKLVIEPVAAAQVQDFYRYYLDSRSIRATLKYALENYGRQWSEFGMRNLLTNEMYKGENYGIKNWCPAIIDSTQFDIVQQIIKQKAARNSSNVSRSYLFQGLCWCSECGRKMRSSTVHGYIYYRCSSYELYKSCEHNHRTNERKIESWLLDNFADILEQDVSVTESRKQPKNDIPKIKRKMEKLKNLYLNDLIDFDAYKKDYEVLKAQLEAAEVPPKQQKNVKEIKKALEVYNELPRLGKKAFWSRLVKRITITNDDQFSVELY